MCGYYNDEHRLRYRPFVPASDALVERTRLIEAGMAGERVPESAWEAFFSPACGAIDLRHFERMFAARKAAVAYLAMRASAPQRRPPKSAFICVADPLPEETAGLGARAPGSPARTPAGTRVRLPGAPTGGAR